MSTGDLFLNETVAIDPRESSKVVATSDWPKAQTIQSIDNEIRLINDTDHPIHIPKNEQLCNVRSTQIVNTKNCENKATPATIKTIIRSTITKPFSSTIQIDPNKQLTVQWTAAFQNLHSNYDNVFDPTIGRYNGHAGKLKARILFGSTVPPPKKLHAPTYSKIFNCFKRSSMN